LTDSQWGLQKASSFEGTQLHAGLPHFFWSVMGPLAIRKLKYICGMQVKQERMASHRFPLLPLGNGGGWRRASQGPLIAHFDHFVLELPPDHTLDLADIGPTSAEAKSSTLGKVVRRRAFRLIFVRYE
jgi:hypothetical protein